MICELLYFTLMYFSHLLTLNPAITDPTVFTTYNADRLIQLSLYHQKRLQVIFLSVNTLTFINLRYPVQNYHHTKNIWSNSIAPGYGWSYDCNHTGLWNTDLNRMRLNNWLENVCHCNFVRLFLNKLGCKMLIFKMPWWFHSKYRQKPWLLARKTLKHKYPTYHCAFAYLKRANKVIGLLVPVGNFPTSVKGYLLQQRQKHKC